MTNAQVEYLKHLETKRHNREMETQGAADVETRKTQAASSATQAKASAAAVPAQYLRALASGGLAGLSLKGLTDAAKRRADSKSQEELFRKAEKTFYPEKQSNGGSIASLNVLQTLKKLLQSVQTSAQPGIWIDKDVIDRIEAQKQRSTTASKEYAEWLKLNPDATAEEKLKHADKLMLLKRKKGTH